jgi:hypothetical protein
VNQANPKKAPKKVKCTTEKFSLTVKLRCPSETQSLSLAGAKVYGADASPQPAVACWELAETGPQSTSPTTQTFDDDDNDDGCENSNGIRDTLFLDD